MPTAWLWADLSYVSAVSATSTYRSLRYSVRFLTVYLMYALSVCREMKHLLTEAYHLAIEHFPAGAAVSDRSCDPPHEGRRRSLCDWSSREVSPSVFFQGWFLTPRVGHVEAESVVCNQRRKQKGANVRTTSEAESPGRR